MTIKNKLYRAFGAILLITIFIIGIFFYTTISLNNLHKIQNHRYEQIRKVERIKELNTSFTWLVLDIIVDRNKKEMNKKQEEFFSDLWQLKQSLLKEAENEVEKTNLEKIFKNFEKIEKLIKEDLEKLLLSNASRQELYKFHDSYEILSRLNEKEIEKEIEFLQNRLNKTEFERESFIETISLELIILLIITFLLAFFISTSLINEIKSMLKKLNNSILHLLKNNEDSIIVDIKKGNELSEIAENFNKYLLEKDEILQSREELLRNISHELKTPITKGKFLLEKLKSDEKLVSDINLVFYDIEELTNKLLEREKLNYAKLNKSSFRVSSMVLESLSKLSIDDESKIFISIDEDFEINADFYYMVITVKNLIDNAFKYSDSFPIYIYTDKNSLYIKNNAEKLSHNFIYYLQPFTREENQQKGHGLGLNIVNKILKLHEFSFEYSYENQYNIFKITFK